jgi:TfoX/Sxy family transcriptional regulator of competence genes
MATEISVVEYILDQIGGVVSARHKKMFGEYMIYCNEKPAFLICDNMLFVKILRETEEILGADSPKAFPYTGAKSYFVVDIDDGETVKRLAETLARVLPLPKKR